MRRKSITMMSLSVEGVVKGRRVEPDDYVDSYTAIVKGFLENEGDFDEEQYDIGKASFQVVHGGNALNDNSEFDLFEICDSHSQELCNMYEVCNGYDCEDSDGLDGSEILYVHTIEIFPEYRRGEIGYRVLASIMDIFPLVDFVIIKPAPINKVGDPTWEHQRKVLMRYWKKFGCFTEHNGHLIYETLNVRKSVSDFDS